MEDKSKTEGNVQPEEMITLYTIKILLKTVNI